MRVERETGRRGNAAVVISTLVSLAVVGVAVAIVAWLVLRTPSSAVDSAERLEPVGTAIAAPTEQPSLPTPIPTPNPEPTALGFTGETPAENALPTVPAPTEQPAESGPTPTPRVVALPTAEPAPAAAPALPPPVATLPPAPVEQVPVVALAPVEPAPAPAPTSPPDTAGQPTPESTDGAGDDPFEIFTDDELPRIVLADNDALERVRDIQDENRERAAADIGDVDRVEPVAAPTVAIPAIEPRDDSGVVEITMPDTEAMIEEITARAMDPNRNPNVNRPANGDDEDRPTANRNDDRRDSITNSGNKRKESSRDRNRRTPTPVADRDNENAGNGGDNNGNNGRNNNNQKQGECENPFSNLPENQRPDNYEFFDKC